MKNKLVFSIISVLLFVSIVNAQKSNTQRLLSLQDQMENAKSSSETGKYNACSQIFDSGFLTANEKSTTLNVRPIRSF